MIKAAMILLTLAGAGLIGNADYRDAQAQHDYQCEMIQAGHWPADVNPRCKEVAQ